MRVHLHIEIRCISAHVRLFKRFLCRRQGCGSAVDFTAASAFAFTSASLVITTASIVSRIMESGRYNVCAR